VDIPATVVLPLLAVLVMLVLAVAVLVAHGRLMAVVVLEY
jgi:hypothetical protein